MAAVSSPSPRYRLGPPVGRGASATVYRAYDRERDRWVALKLGEEGVEALRREHAALARVRHPHVVEAFELVPGPPPAFAMELVEGPDLVRWVREDVPGAPRRAGPRRNLPMAFGYTLQEEGRSAYAPCTARGAARLRSALRALAGALEAVHGAGLLHLDVTRANVRVAGERPVLLDLGLARERGGREPLEVAGTAAALAPELGDGAPGPGADWYALGVLAFEALTGRLPFDGGDVEVLVRKQSVSAPRAADVAPGAPADLDAACAALLAPSPRERADGAALRALLDGGRAE